MDTWGVVMGKTYKTVISIVLLGVFVLRPLAVFAREGVSDNAVLSPSLISEEAKREARDLKVAGVDMVFDSSVELEDYRDYLTKIDAAEVSGGDQSGSYMLGELKVERIPVKEEKTESSVSANSASAVTGEEQTRESLPEEESRESEAAEMVTGDGAGSIVMANVSDTLNVRQEPFENAPKVGFLYKDCGGKLLERKGGWTKLESGNVTGWARDDFLLFGEEALKLYQEVGNKTASVKADALRVRKSPSTDSGIYGMLGAGESLDVVEESDPEWVAVDYDGDVGYVSREFVEISFRVDSGETIEQVKQREEAEEQKRKDAAKQRLNEQKKEAQEADGTRLLAALVQCEAANQPFEGQVAVAAVVMNRVKSGGYPNSISGVIFASGQFTPAQSGKVMKAYNGTIRSSCMEAAASAISGYSNVGNATHFKVAGLHEGLVIGNHVFW